MRIDDCIGYTCNCVVAKQSAIKLSHINKLVYVSANIINCTLVATKHTSHTVHSSD